MDAPTRTWVYLGTEMLVRTWPGGKNREGPRRRPSKELGPRLSPIILSACSELVASESPAQISLGNRAGENTEEPLRAPKFHELQCGAFLVEASGREREIVGRDGSKDQGLTERQVELGAPLKMWVNVPGPLPGNKDAARVRVPIGSQGFRPAVVVLNVSSGWHAKVRGVAKAKTGEVGGKLGEAGDKVHAPPAKTQSGQKQPRQSCGPGPKVGLPVKGSRSEALRPRLVTLRFREDRDRARWGLQPGWPRRTTGNTGG